MASKDVPTDLLPQAMQLLFEDLVSTVAPVLEWLSWLLGGIFGLYLLYFLIKLYFDRKRIKILQEVQGDVEFLKEHSLSRDELSKLRVILDEHPSVKKKDKRKASLKKKKSTKKRSGKGKKK